MDYLVSLVNTNESLQLNVALSEDPESVNFRESKTQTTILHFACQAPNVCEEIPRLLVLFKADINAQDSKGLTPLHYACTRGNWKICKMLLSDSEVNVSIPAHDSFTPFAYAVNYPFRKIPNSDIPIYSEILQSLGSDDTNIRCTDSTNNSTLHLAAKQGNKIALEFILSAGIAIDAQNDTKETPLIISIEQEKPNIAKQLLQHGANPQITRADGKSAYDLAKAKSFVELLDIMTPKMKQNAKWKVDSPRGTLRRVSVLTQHRITSKASKKQPVTNISPQDMRAMLSIEELLRKLESLQFSSSKDKKVQQSSSAVLSIREFLKISIKKADVSPCTHEIRWAAIFQERLFSTSSVLSQHRIATLTSTIEQYIKHEASPSTYAEVAKSLLRYLNSHKYDPENSIIGLRCKPNIVGGFLQLALMILQAQKMFGSDLWLFGAFPGTTAVFDIVIDKHDIYLQMDDILNNKGYWTPEETVERSRLFLQFCEAADQLHTFWPEEIVLGSIILVATDSSDREDPFPELPALSNQEREIEFVFMRYAGEFDRELRQLTVYDTGAEYKTKPIPIHCCMPIPESWNMNFGSKKSMNRLLKNPANSLLSRIALYLKKSLDELLQSEKLDLELLERIITFNVEVSESTQIKELMKKIQSLQHTFPKQFLTKMTKMRDECIAKFNASPLVQQLFVPTKQANLNDLTALSMETSIAGRLGQLVSYCHQALKYLESQKKLVVDGTKKQEITTWWLGIIEKNVRSFLEGLGYDFTAVRYDYIETPPDDLVAVRENLAKIGNVLDKTVDKYNVKSLLDTIKSIVYPKIDLFIENAQVALCEKLSICGDDFTITKCFSVIEDLKKSGEEVSGGILALEYLVKDIEYLETIKRLEVEKPTGKGDLNVVPISGLVMGSFFRLENELKTVLEVWDPTWKLTKKKDKNELTKRESTEKHVTMILASRSETMRATTHSILTNNPDNIRNSICLQENTDGPLANSSVSSLLNHKVNTGRSDTKTNLRGGQRKMPQRGLKKPAEEQKSQLQRKKNSQIESKSKSETEKEMQGKQIPEQNNDGILEERKKEEPMDPLEDEEHVVLIDIDEMMENLNKMETLSRKGSLSRVYANERQTQLEQAAKQKSLKTLRKMFSGSK